jgi:hypothetical protein
MYRAPEMVDLYMRDQLTEKSDIWALGCVFFALCFLKHPFQDVGSLGILAGKYTIPAHAPVSEDAITILKRMLDIDPEARPIILELLLAMREISKGSPLPPYELSAEALQRRAARIAADEVRNTKTKKKPTATPIDTKRSAPPSANSVAAKRLAAKRGVSVDATDNHLTPGPSSSFQEDLFSNSNASVGNFAFPGNNDGTDFVQDAGFDPFDDVGPANHHSNSSDSAVDVWDATSGGATTVSATVRRPSFSTADDAFAPTVTSHTVDHKVKSDEFDPFSNDSPRAEAVPVVDSTSQFGEFDPFAPAEAVVEDSAAIFDDSGFQPTQATRPMASALLDTVDDTPVAPPTTAVKPKRPSFATADQDGFDMFDNSVASTPVVVSAVTTVAHNDDDLFDPPSSTPAKRLENTLSVSTSESTFDPFEPSTASKPAASPQNFSPLSSFSNPTTSVHPSSASNSAHQLHDLIFASSAPSTSHSATINQATSNSNSAFDALPNTPLEPARAAPVVVATHDLLELPVHHSSTSSTSTSTFSATTPSGKGSLGPADVLSLYDAPKSEAPLKPMRPASAKSMPFGDELLPPPQALGYVPARGVGLGGGRPMPPTPMMGSMSGPPMGMGTGTGMGMGMNYTQPPNGPSIMRPMSSSISPYSSSSISPGSSSSSSSSSTMTGVRPNMGMNSNVVSPRGVVGSFRPAAADPFDSLNQFKK